MSAENGITIDAARSAIQKWHNFRAQAIGWHPDACLAYISMQPMPHVLSLMSCGMGNLFGLRYEPVHMSQSSMFL